MRTLTSTTTAARGLRSALAAAGGAPLPPSQVSGATRRPAGQMSTALARSPAGKPPTTMTLLPAPTMTGTRSVAKARLLAVIDGPGSRSFRPSTMATLSMGLTAQSSRSSWVVGASASGLGTRAMSTHVAVGGGSDGGAPATARFSARLQTLLRGSGNGSGTDNNGGSGSATVDRAMQFTPLYPTIQPRSTRKAATLAAGAATAAPPVASPTLDRALRRAAGPTAPTAVFVPLYPTIQGRRSARPADAPLS